MPGQVSPLAAGNRLCPCHPQRGGVASIKLSAPFLTRQTPTFRVGWTQFLACFDSPTGNLYSNKLGGLQVGLEMAFLRSPQPPDATQGPHKGSVGPKQQPGVTAQCLRAALVRVAGLRSPWDL